ncbi:CotH kinase family protein [Candidatus Pelagibacter bacterium nBUS_32]|uniref:CotH kinase family protein n=1 Tax=Candidatus Pelagibacter bacterium nBUS_32 TaxID=3374192 RepID=UPI003EBFA189
MLITPGFKGDLAQSLRIILQQPVLLKTKNVHDNKILDYSLKILYGIENRLFNSPNLENLNIDIKFDELEKLKNDRVKALKLRQLDDPQKVNITISHGNRKYKAIARLKGDQPGHWTNIKQWSLRIKLRKNKTIFSMNEFSLTIPYERNYPNIFIFSDILKENNLLTPRHKIVKVTLNGDDWGLMTLEEQFHDSFYAINKIKEAPIFKTTNENHFTIENMVNSVDGIYANTKIINIEDIIRWQGKLETKIYNKKEILKKTNIPNINTNETLLSIFKTIQEVMIKKDERFLKKINKYIDIISFARVSALTAFWGDTHSKYSYNSRYYIDPYDLKIRPILTDSLLAKVDKNFFNEHNLFYKNIFSLDSFQKEYFLTLKKIEKNFPEIEKKFKIFCKKFGKNCFNWNDLNILRDNLNFLISTNKEIFNIPVTPEKLTFDTKNPYNLNKKKIHFRAFSNGDVLIDNLTSEYLDIKNITLKKSNDCKIDCIKLNKNIIINLELKPSTFENIATKEIKVNIPDKSYKFLELKYLDEDRKSFSLTEKIENIIFKKDNLLSKKEIKLNSFIKIKDKDYILSKGNYNINYPIIVPPGYNLIIEEGVSIKMAKNTYIMVRDGLLKLQGSADSPIKITSQLKDNYWKGIYVNKSSKNDVYSILNHVKISNFTYFDNQFIQLTGGLNFINSNVKLTNSFVEKSYAEDAINLVKSNFIISDLDIQNSKSDGIDVDFGEGKISRSSFNNIVGDAIDLSGSKISIDQVNIKNIGDKAISVGENTQLEVTNAIISYSRIGIASKDASNVIGSNINISNCGLFDFAVYQKKKYFSGATLKTETNSSCNRSLVQLGNELIINNKKIAEKKFNVKKLYDGTL